MFFDREYPYLIMDEKIEELEDKLNVKTSPRPRKSSSEEWAYYSYLKGLDEGLNEMYAINFGYTISSFVAGMGVDAGTDVYFRESLDDQLFNIYENCPHEGTDGVRRFFRDVLEFYKSDDGACIYERAVFHHNIRCSREVKEYLQSYSDTISLSIRLLLHDTTNQEHVYVDGKNENITFKLTYTDEMIWSRLGGDDPSRLRKLLEA